MGNSKNNSGGGDKSKDGSSGRNSPPPSGSRSSTKQQNSSGGNNHKTQSATGRGGGRHTEDSNSRREYSDSRDSRATANKDRGTQNRSGTKDRYGNNQQQSNSRGYTNQRGRGNTTRGQGGSGSGGNQQQGNRRRYDDDDNSDRYDSEDDDYYSSEDERPEAPWKAVQGHRDKVPAVNTSKQPWLNSAVPYFNKEGLNIINLRNETEELRATTKRRYPVDKVSAAADKVASEKAKNKKGAVEGVDVVKTITVGGKEVGKTKTTTGAASSNVADRISAALNAQKTTLVAPITVSASPPAKTLAGNISTASGKNKTDTPTKASTSGDASNAALAEDVDEKKLRPNAEPWVPGPGETAPPANGVDLRRFATEHGIAQNSGMTLGIPASALNQQPAEAVTKPAQQQQSFTASTTVGGVTTSHEDDRKKDSTLSPLPSLYSDEKWAVDTGSGWGDVAQILKKAPGAPVTAPPSAPVTATTLPSPSGSASGFSGFAVGALAAPVPVAPSATGSATGHQVTQQVVGRATTQGPPPSFSTATGGGDLPEQPIAPTNTQPQHIQQQLASALAQTPQLTTAAGQTYYVVQQPPTGTNSYAQPTQYTTSAAQQQATQVVYVNQQGAVQGYGPAANAASTYTTAANYQTPVYYAAQPQQTAGLKR